MKKLFVAVGMFMLIGAGCFGIGEKSAKNAIVIGDWTLAFDLPADWVMVSPYAVGSAVNLDNKIEKTQNEVYLQSTDKAVLFGDQESDEPGTETISENVAKISVSRLDARRVEPDTAVDLGNGFSLVKICEDNGECRQGDKLNYEYYLTLDDVKYKFVVLDKGIDRGIIEKIITSAKKVTEVSE